MELNKFKFKRDANHLTDAFYPNTKCIQSKLMLQNLQTLA